VKSFYFSVRIIQPFSLVILFACFMNTWLLVIRKSLTFPAWILQIVLKVDASNKYIFGLFPATAIILLHGDLTSL
jgi:hypothetical protein